jgi:aspartate aminotransferase
MANFSVSKNVAAMQPSSTLAAMQAAQTLRASGADVIDLSVGEPDFDTPEFIKEAAWDALKHGKTKYTATAGIKSLQDNLVKFYSDQFGTEYKPSQVMATSGGKQAIFNAVVTAINPGEEILIPKPYWVSFPEIAHFAGAKPVYIETEDTHFVLTAEQVKAAITPNSKLIILNSPSNPSGRVIPAGEFRKIVEVCHEHNILIISDECYLLFVYPPNEVFTAATLPAELRENICIAGSFSKTYAMTGWRMGYTIAREEWTKAMLKVQSHSTSHPASFAQYACAAALERWSESSAAIQDMLAEYEKRRAWFIPALQNIPGFKCDVPEGAFYAFPDVRGALKEAQGEMKVSNDLSKLLLEKAHVVTTDGAGFGAEGFVRISYAASMERLQEAVERIRKVLEV